MLDKIICWLQVACGWLIIWVCAYVLLGVFTIAYAYDDRLDPVDNSDYCNGDWDGTKYELKPWQETLPHPTARQCWQFRGEIICMKSQAEINGTGQDSDIYIDGVKQ